MDCNDGRSIHIISFEFIQYFPLLLTRNYEMHTYPMTWIVDLEDLIITIFNIILKPRITNELQKKLHDKLPTVPIWMDCNWGRFFNSNSPAKTVKLYSPIWMDSNDSQFNMWNDFDVLLALFESHLSVLFNWVNELFPILIVFNRFNPSILNVFTDPKQSSPISIDSTRVNREKSNIV